MSDIWEQRQKTSTVSALDRFGWTRCNVVVQRQILMTVHITAGVYTVVDITITSLFPALQVRVGVFVGKSLFHDCDTFRIP